MTDEGMTNLLTGEMDEDVLAKMPDWFRFLRENYQKSKGRR